MCKKAKKINSKQINIYIHLILIIIIIITIILLGTFSCPCVVRLVCVHGKQGLVKTFTDRQMMANW